MTMGEPPEIAVVGAVVLDEIHSADGEVVEQVGGSSLYAALGASLLADAAPVSLIGDDFAPARLQPFEDRGIRLDGIVRVDGPNFRWACQYSADGDDRETLFTRGGVFDSHPIVVPEPFRDAKMVLLTSGNPMQNLCAYRQMRSPAYVAFDTIEREVAQHTDELRSQLHVADLVSINTRETAALIGWPSHHLDPAMPIAAWREIKRLGASAFVLKRASQGVEVFEAGRRTIVDAVPNIEATDPTGAGDTFLGALLSALVRGRDLVEAAVWGCAAASFAIEQYGFAGLFQASRESVAARAAQISVSEWGEIDATSE